MSTLAEAVRSRGHAQIPITPQERTQALVDYVRKMNQLGVVEFKVSVDPENPITATVKRRGYDLPKETKV